VAREGDQLASAGGADGSGDVGFPMATATTRVRDLGKITTQSLTVGSDMTQSGSGGSVLGRLTGSAR
jgi:hypothetical protein